jgi:hypothetical protein
MNDGLTEEEARLKANRKLNDVDLDQFMSRYCTLNQSSPSSIIVYSSKRDFLDCL